MDTAKSPRMVVTPTQFSSFYPASRNVGLILRSKDTVILCSIFSVFLKPLDFVERWLFVQF